jgi:hypothetical protein
MKWNRIGARVDASIGDLSEHAARKLSRRDTLRVGMLNGVAGIGALALGKLNCATQPIPKCSKEVDCGPTRRCSGCPGTGCPSAYHLCKSTGQCGPGGTPNSQGYYCEWCSGSWIACNGAGSFGNGYYICYDCVDQGCAGWCTCLSECICCNCTNEKDLKTEQKRLDLLMAAAERR